MTGLQDCEGYELGKSRRRFSVLYWGLVAQDSGLGGQAEQFEFEVKGREREEGDGN